MTETKKKPIDKQIKISEDTQRKFLDCKLLELIKQELDKEHVGNNKEKMLVFLIAVSGLLPTRHRCSCALNGDTSEGKTNIMKAVELHLPDEKYRWYDGVTKSGVQGDLKDDNNVGTIFFKELNKKDENYAMSEFLKSVCEEGHSETKRNIETNNKELVTHKIPKLAGIYATTEMVDDDELINRFIVISIVGNKNLYKKVNDNTKQIYKDVSLQIEHDVRKTNGTWIKQALTQLLTPVDYFKIPSIDCVKPNNETARSKRDLKRFLNIACVIAWLYQKQRTIETIDNHSILEVLPEDLINAYNIMSKSLTQSFNNLNQRDLDTLDIIEKLSKSQPQQSLDVEKQYVERRILQSHLKINSRSGVWKRLSSLKSSDAITIIDDKEHKNKWITINADVVELLKGAFIGIETITCLKELITNQDLICFEGNEYEPDDEIIEGLTGCIDYHHESLTREQLQNEDKNFSNKAIDWCIGENLIFEDSNGIIKVVK